jgi:hypothetical protein
MTAHRITACQLAVAMLGHGPATLEERIDEVIKLTAFFEALITEADPPDAPAVEDYPRLGNGLL